MADEHTWPDAVVLAGGAPLPASLLHDVADAIDHAALTVAADAGLHHAHRADREVDVLIGDLDSVDAHSLARAREAGTDVRTHPVDKDATDLELALDVVLEHAARGGRVDEGGERGERGERPDVLVIGGHGGRTDHLIANLLLLAAARYAPLRLRAWWGVDVVHVVRDTVTLTGEVGGRVSLLALHGAVEGVSTTGLRFPLTDAVLEAGSSLGMSNALSGPHATVTVQRGVLAVLQCPDP
jgi:thiamine pyrophosphokinase